MLHNVEGSRRTNTTAIFPSPKSFKLAKLASSFHEFPNASVKIAVACTLKCVEVARQSNSAVALSIPSFISTRSLCLHEHFRDQEIAITAVTTRVTVIVHGVEVRSSPPLLADLSFLLIFEIRDLQLPQSISQSR